MLKKLVLSMAVASAALFASAHAGGGVRVRGYLRASGGYTVPHYRSRADGNFYNNWSTYPNINPYTGAIGTRRTPSYSYGYRSRYFGYRGGYSGYGSRYSGWSW